MVPAIWNLISKSSIFSSTVMKGFSTTDVTSEGDKIQKTDFKNWRSKYFLLDLYSIKFFCYPM